MCKPSLMLHILKQEVEPSSYLYKQDQLKDR